MARYSGLQGLLAIEPLIEGLTSSEAGIALRLLLWQAHGKPVPFSDLEACYAVACAWTKDEHAACSTVVERLFSPVQPPETMSENGESGPASVVTNVVTRDHPRDHPFIPLRDTFGNSRDHPAESISSERNPPVSSLDRQRSTRTKKRALRELLKSDGVPVTARYTMTELVNIARHRGMAVDDIISGVSENPEKWSRLARVCVLNSKSNTEIQNTSLKNTHCRGALRRARDPLAVEAAAAMRAAGLPEADEAHPELTAVLALGATVPELRLAAVEAEARGKGFGYALGIARNRRLDLAQAAAPSPSAAPATALLAPEPHDGVPLPDELLARIQALKNPRRPSVETSSQPHEDRWSLDESRT